MHNADIKCFAAVNFFHFIRKFRKAAIKLAYFGKHHHYKHILQNRLGNINYVCVTFGAYGAYLCNNTYGILAYNRYNCFHYTHPLKLLTEYTNTNRAEYQLHFKTFKILHKKSSEP